MTPGSATLADYMAGLYGALGVMMALRARDASGRGQQIDIGLYEPIFRILDEMAPAYDKVGFIRQRMGRRPPTSVRTAITRPATDAGSRLPAPTTRSSPAWPS